MNGFVELGTTCVNYYENDRRIYSVILDNLYTDLFSVKLCRIVEIDTNVSGEFVRSIHDIIMVNINRFNELYGSMCISKICKLPAMDTHVNNSDEYRIFPPTHDGCMFVTINCSPDCTTYISIAFQYDGAHMYTSWKGNMRLTFNETFDDTLDAEYYACMVHLNNIFEITEEEFNEELFIEYIKKFIKNNKELVAFPDFPIQQLKSSRK